MVRAAAIGLACLFLLAPATARAAASSPWIETEQAAIRLVAGKDALGAEAEVALGLEFRLKPGWKLYWRHPGEAGVPPSFDWSGSRNLAAMRVLWPAPRRVSIEGIDSFVYLDEVILPLRARAADLGRPLELRLALSYGICREICIPYDETLSLDLPAGAARPTPFAGRIAQFAARVPLSPTAAGVTLRVAAAEADGKPALEVTAEAPRPWQRPDLFVEAPPPLWFGAPVVALENGGRTARLLLPVSAGRRAAVLAGAVLTLTLVDGALAVEDTATMPR
jgi:suppressor for copper-sensitivity B